MSAHVCTMISSVKGTASKQRIKAVATISVAESAVYASATASSLDGSKCSGLNLQRDLFPQDGALPSESFMSSLKAPSCSESARSSLTASNSARDDANTIYLGSGGGVVSLIRQQVPKRSGGLIPQDGSLPFNPSVRSPNPPSSLDSARASITARDSASNSTSHCGRRGGGVIMIGQKIAK